MKTLILITCIQNIILVKSGELSATESYTHSYKVHPDPLEVEEEEEDPGLLFHKHIDKMTTGDNGGNLNSVQIRHFATSNQVENANSLWLLPKGNHVVDERNPVNQSYSLAHRSPDSSEEIQEQHKEIQYLNGANKHPEVTPAFVQDDKENETPYHEKTEFSSIVERIVKSDPGFPLEEEKPFGKDVKRAIPKSNVYFQVYHFDKEGGEQETTYQSNVHHTQSEDTRQLPHATQYNHNVLHYESPEKFDTNKNSVNLVGVRPVMIQGAEKSFIHTKLPLHSKTKAYSAKDSQKTGHQSTSIEPVFQVDGKVQNREQSTLNSQAIKEQKFKFSIPVKSLNSQYPQQYYSHQPQHYYHTFHQYRKPSPEEKYPTKSQIKISEPKPFPFYTSQKQPIVTIGHQAQSGSIQQPKISKDVKSGAGTKSVQPLLQKVKSPASYAVTEEEDENYKPESTQKAVSTTLSDTVFIGGLPPWKFKNYLKKFQNPWKNLNNIPTFKSIDFHHSFSHLPLVYKPADSFHFEVNPFIDIGENNQKSFDHKKALAGSTTFDIKHAIGNEHEQVDLRKNVISAAEEVPTIVTSPTNPTSVLGNRTFAYPSSATVVVPTTVLIPNTDLVKFTPASTAEFDGSYVWQSPASTALVDSHFKQGNVGSDLKYGLMKQSDKELWKHKIPLKLTSNLIPTFTKSKPTFMTFKDPAWEKLIQQPKKNQQLLLQATIRPSQKLFPVANNDWVMREPKLKIKKSKKLVLKTDALPLSTELSKKSFPVWMSSPKSRKHRNVNFDFVTLKTGDSQSKFRLANRKNLYLNSPMGLNGDGSKAEKGNSFWVSASYKVDRASKKDFVKELLK